MVLIYGGAYQGKRDFAVKQYGINDSDIFTFDEKCDASELPEHKCLQNFHLFIFALINAGADPLAYVSEHIGSLDGKMIISDDISCGVVPMGAENRAWREAAGRCLTLLSKRSAEVWRVFCGIPTRLK